MNGTETIAGYYCEPTIKNENSTKLQLMFHSITANRYVCSYIKEDILPSGLWEERERAGDLQNEYSLLKTTPIETTGQRWEVRVTQLSDVCQKLTLFQGTTLGYDSYKPEIYSWRHYANALGCKYLLQIQCSESALVH